MGKHSLKRFFHLTALGAVPIFPLQCPGADSTKLDALAAIMSDYSASAVKDEIVKGELSKYSDACSGHGIVTGRVTKVASHYSLDKQERAGFPRGREKTVLSKI